MTEPNFCHSEEGCEHREGVNCDGKVPDCVFLEAKVQSTALVQIAPANEEAVILLLNRAQHGAAKADIFVVASVEDIDLATTELSIIAGLKHEIDAKRREYTEPITAHLDTIRQVFKQLSDPVDYADTTLRNKVKVYKAEVERKRFEAAEIARLEREAAERKAKLNGTPVQEVTPTLAPVAVPSFATTEFGTSSGMVVWKYEIVDPALIPRHYMKIDEVAIGKAVRASKGSTVIPGVRIFPEETLRVERLKE